MQIITDNKSNHSDYIIYVDESGDHGLKTIDVNYPVFVLVFTIFEIKKYVQNIVPTIQQFKFDYFGHDQAILHETDIRKDRGAFSFLKSKELKNKFIDELTGHVSKMDFTVIASVIDKNNYSSEDNPYHTALGFGLERVYSFLLEQGQPQEKAHVIVEKRGKVEDRELELEFRRVCNGMNWHQSPLPLEIIFADKKSNSIGLQIADLIARPIGLKTIKKDQTNKAFDVIKTKFRASKSGQVKGYGLKIYP